MIRGSWGWKSRLTKAAGAEPSGQTIQVPITFGSWAYEKVHAKNKTHRSRAAFGSWDVKKLHTPLWHKAHVQVKCAEHSILGQLLEIEMSKKCAPLRHEAHVEVKCAKHTIPSPVLEVEMSKKRAIVARSAFLSQKWLKRDCGIFGTTTTTTTPTTTTSTILYPQFSFKILS